MISIHAIVGISTLILNLLVFITIFRRQKGLHKKIGYYFIVFATTTSLLGIYISLIKDMPILTAIGFFTLIQLMMGLRALKNKKYIASKVDVLLLILYIVNLIYMAQIYSSISTALFFVYSIIFLFHTYHLFYKNNKESSLYLSQHIDHMIGVSVSVVTAFFIGAIGILNKFFIFWIIPTIIFYFFAKYLRLKYAPIRAIKLWR